MIKKLISMIEYIILGTIQGIFEWLPISSQGIMAIVSQFLIEDFRPLEIALFAHLGTFFAALIYFRKEWITVLTFKDKGLFRFLFISTVISGVIGTPIYFLIENIAVGSGLLIITGFGLLVTAYSHKAKRFSGLEFNRLAILSGILQGFSIIPGLSRSGITIFALSFGKLGPKEILKVSYMMSAPVTLGVVAMLVLKNPSVLEVWPILISSFIVGFLTLKFLITVADKISFFKFALIFALLCFLGAGLEIVF